ncbi:hemolysin type calcium-binding protein [Asanoa ferruginea]|uniref:Hemolysin type calcium-binding protein n=1 Tax=Asanoa ferruginea TaxID=53367 RepID=A0A3D9ZVT3_9ACTN|nr:calcium-binding protein [Asanoa ferruginea]REG01326.1 hemolysin type calcium-binding protein [Asanoa ferruginea]GIF52184.1 hypothetical protein Afe04nite_67230 [Asanoa ferruginea]
MPTLRIAVAAGLGLLITAVVPAAAAAAPPPSPNKAYWADDNHLRYEGGIGKTNNLTITNYGRLPGVTKWLFDDVSQIVPGVGCVNVTGDNTKAICTEQDNTISWFAVYLGMGNDTLVFDAFFDTYTRIYGGTGGDTITVGDSADPYVEVYGEDGDDMITRTAGDSYLRISGGPGADELCGTDAYVTYDDHPAAVFVSLGGPAGDDGMPGEGDTVCGTVAGVSGTGFADGLVAGSGPADLSGKAGADVLVGGASSDTLFGGEGNDLIFGYAGDDWLVGEGGADTLNGGTGADDRCDYDALDTISACEDAY